MTKHGGCHVQGMDTNIHLIGLVKEWQSHYFVLLPLQSICGLLCDLLICIDVLAPFCILLDRKNDDSLPKVNPLDGNIDHSCTVVVVVHDDVDVDACFDLQLVAVQP